MFVMKLPIENYVLLYHRQVKYDYGLRLKLKTLV